MKPTKRTGRGIALATMLAAGFAALSIGCQTAIPVSYMEPAKVSLGNVNKIGLMSNSDEVQKFIEGALTKTGKYTIASAAEMGELSSWLLQQERLTGGIEISAAALASEYDANEVRADQKYDGKNLKVTGTVSEFQRGAVRLGVGNNSVDVYIVNQETDKVAALNKGDTITVVGKCSGLKPPYSDGINEILAILGGGGKHVNLAGAMFFITEYTGPVDAVLKLNENHNEKMESRENSKPVLAADGKTQLKDASGKTVYKKVTEYRKILSVNVVYDITNTRDGAKIGNGSADGKYTTDYNENQSQLTTTSKLVSLALGTPLKKIASDLVPTQRTLSVKLAKSDTQDKDVKNALNEANKLVKAKEYAKAAEAFGKIYAQSKDFAAGYNQAVLTEVALGTDKAVILMEEVAKTSDRDEAKSMLSEMQSRNAANKRAAEQLK